jgi:tetratricopeptide (TPR) repeat protein
MRLKKWKEAVRDYSKVISLKPYGWGGWNRRSIAYAELGQYEKAIADYRKAVEIVMEGARESPKGSEYPFSRLASCANRLAWGLVTSPAVSRRDAATAVELAEKAVSTKAEESTYWNTLGAAYYRAGRFEDSIRALRKSIELGTSRYRGTDLFFMAMAEFQLDMKEEARESYNEAVEWRRRHKPDDEELERFGAEAAELLGIAEEAVEKEEETEN